MIQIDKEFQALIPPLAAEEKAQLEANIVADGCRDPLVVWPMPTYTVDYSDDQDGSDVETHVYEDAQIVRDFDGKDGEVSYRQWGGEGDDPIFEEEWPHILVDGHNRYEICTRLGLPFEVVQKEFEGRDNVTEWIINNQFGRRNLSDYQRGVLALRMKPIIEARARAQQGERTDIRPISDESTADIFTGEAKPVAPASPIAPPIRTDTAVASLANLGKDTIRKIEHIEADAAPEVKALAAADAVSINLAAQFTDLPQETQQEALAAIAQSEPAKEVMREAVKNHRTIGTGENEWYTPAEYVEMARKVMGGIDLDPASCAQANEVVAAATFYTKEDDGLSKDWAGRLWLNPPYSRDLMPAFVEKLRTSYLEGEVDQAVLVSHNNTDTAWFHNLASVASAICFPKKRIRFYRDEEIAAPTNGQAFFYLGEAPEQFIEAFSDVGFVVRPV